ncbi:MAG: hypothetical protein MI784_06045, partial [Cytophagales bacterium]|nr:hypothetical protein [Cytophagales bacterium]
MKIKNYLFLVFFLGCCLQAFSQKYPLRITLSGKPAMSPYLEDIVNERQSNLNISLRLLDQQATNREIRLRFELKSAKIS